MRTCAHPGCSWQPVAPSEAAAMTSYAEHLVDAHARAVDADIPDGMVQVKLGDGEEWVTTTPEDAGDLHDARHGEGD